MRRLVRSTSWSRGPFLNTDRSSRRGSDDPFDSDDWWDSDGFLFGLHELLNPVRVPFIANELHRAHARTVLDVGCGGGFVAEALAGGGFTVTGIDRSMAAATAAARSAFSTTHYIGADAHRLPFDDAVFDGVILSEVLEHVERPGVAFSEAARVLAPGGALVVTGPNRTFLSRLVLIWLAQDWPTGVLPKGLHEYRRFLQPQEVAVWCERAGLKPGVIRGIGIRPRHLPSAMAAIARLRRGTITYPRAAGSIRLAEVRPPVIAYMASATKGARSRRSDAESTPPKTTAD